MDVDLRRPYSTPIDIKTDLSRVDLILTGSLRAMIENPEAYVGGILENLIRRFERPWERPEVVCTQVMRQKGFPGMRFQVVENDSPFVAAHSPILRVGDAPREVTADDILVSGGGAGAESGGLSVRAAGAKRKSSTGAFGGRARPHRLARPTDSHRPAVTGRWRVVNPAGVK